MESLIDEVLHKCNYTQGRAFESHIEVGKRPPRTGIQNHFSIGAVHFEGRNFLHSVNHCKAWSETGIISRKATHVRILVFHRIHLLSMISQSQYNGILVRQQRIQGALQRLSYLA